MQYSIVAVRRRKDDVLGLRGDVSAFHSSQLRLANSGFQVTQVCHFQPKLITNGCGFFNVRTDIFWVVRV